MNIIALYKAWSGEEWLKASVASIINHVNKVVILTSDVSWIGGKNNPSLLAINDLKVRFTDKVVHIRYNEPNQVKHCLFGYNYIRDNFPNCDYIQLIDSDEIWDDSNYNKAKDTLESNKESNFIAFRTNIYTYIKSPFYRIEPIEPLKPVCFIKTKYPDMGLEPRGCGLKPFMLMGNVFYHHFVFVRYHFNRVLEKLVQSHVSENQAYEPMDMWIPHIWNKLPIVERTAGFHPAIGFGHNWMKVKIVNQENLPEVLGRPEFRSVLKYGQS